MITNLHIRNFALIDNCEISLSNSLNIISGETGSGKSIIIQALAILLGERASIDQIRTGMDEAILSATISIEQNQEIINYLKELGISVEEDELILRRHLLASGKSRSFINSVQVTSKELSFISSVLFDFHGQHDGIGLLKKETHCTYLDNYLKLGDKTAQIKTLFTRMSAIHNELANFNKEASDRERKTDLLKYEIEEITNAKLQKGEEEELGEKIKIMSNIEKIMAISGELDYLLGGENGAVQQLKQAKSLIMQLSDLDTNYAQYENTLSDTYYKIEDLHSEITSKISRYRYNPDLLDELISRSDTYDKLKRKYGKSYDSIMEYLHKAQNDLLTIDNREEIKNALLEEYRELCKEYSTLAEYISQERTAKKKNLEMLIIEELKTLGMSDPSFEIAVQQDEEEGSPILSRNKKVRYTPSGIDRVEFLISPNKGEPVKSLSKIASGGELSRIVLALKTILGKTDSVRTMIFDEIDVGIGGKVAVSVSKKIKALSADKQIICITHLPQIAAAGYKNFVIHKELSGERTISTLTELDEQMKVEEIARMLSGSSTENSMRHAAELIATLSS